jgi:para-nitrobenzyl esterase
MPEPTKNIYSAVERAATGSLRRMAKSAVAALVYSACEVLILVGARAQTPPLTGVVHTAEGDVQGILSSGVNEFLSIPYAAPPVGELRWRPPADVTHWKEARAATRFGGTCAQPERGIFTVPSTNEDCLYLNVYTTDPLPAAGANRPVMVWFYGGGMYSGESNDYDGSKLVRRGGVVVVTLNYRVGAFGFFSHPAINGEGHLAINYGIMDQQAALRWVRRNIAAFGGDPNNVTIFGQSGGGTSVTSNLQSPLSAGLFHRAIVESGVRIEYVSLEARTKAAIDFAAEAGCTDQSARCLRALTPQQILAHDAGILRLVTVFPSPDGAVITHPAAEAFSQGFFNHVPIMAGLVSEEQAYFLPETNSHVPLTAKDVDAYVASFGPRFTQRLEAKYPVASFASPSVREIAMAQAQKSCTERFMEQSWSKFVPVYAYEFRERTAPSYFQPVSYPMNAFHTSELQYLFPLFHGGQGTAHPLNAAQEHLSDILVDYWSTFARTGAPDAPGHSDLPAWPRYSADKDNIQAIDLPGQTQVGGYGKMYDCDFWDPIVASQIWPPK